MVTLIMNLIMHKRVWLLMETIDSSDAELRKFYVITPKAVYKA